MSSHPRTFFQEYHAETCFLQKLIRVEGKTEMKQLLIMYTFIGGILRGAFAEQATSPVRQKN